MPFSCLFPSSSFPPSSHLFSFPLLISVQEIDAIRKEVEEIRKRHQEEQSKAKTTTTASASSTSKPAATSTTSPAAAYVFPPPPLSFPSPLPPYLFSLAIYPPSCISCQLKYLISYTVLNLRPLPPLQRLLHMGHLNLQLLPPPLPQLHPNLQLPPLLPLQYPLSLLLPLLLPL